MARRQQEENTPAQAAIEASRRAGRPQDPSFFKKRENREALSGLLRRDQTEGPKRLAAARARFGQNIGRSRGRQTAFDEAQREAARRRGMTRR